MPAETKTPEDVPQAPVATDLYEVLGVPEDATQDQIKSAYRKLALKHHPDKVPAGLKDEAHSKFQQIAFAYAILSDKRRRKRFDLTGSTAEAAIEDESFDWVDFYRDLYSNAVDSNALEKIKREYQGSAEEEKDILEAFDNHRGEMDRVYESVMFCNVLDDDERFRAIIDKAIAGGKVEGYKMYTGESEKKRQMRIKRAQKEAQEADALAKELEKKKESKAQGKGKAGKKKKGTDLADLAVVIKQRQASRMDSFLERLESEAQLNAGDAKTTGKKRAAAKFEEPSEEAFAAMGARLASKKKKKVNA